MSDVQAQINVSVMRRLWMVVLLTCLLVTFPIAMVLLLTGDVYRKRNGQFVPIGKSSRYVYGGLLALWLVAVVARSVVTDGSFLNLSGLSADSHSSNTASGVPDMCDSSDASEMVKGALEGSNSAIENVKVLDFGHAQETVFDKSKNVRHCQAEAVLNSGDAIVTYQLYFGPSGGELVQVEQGIRAEQQQIIDRDFEKDAAALAEANKTVATAATSASSAEPY
jgi:hypothetical protein